jgi:hypothetical protein
MVVVLLKKEEFNLFFEQALLFCASAPNWAQCLLTLAATAARSEGACTSLFLIFALLAFFSVLQTAEQPAKLAVFSSLLRASHLKRLVSPSCRLRIAWLQSKHPSKTTMAASTAELRK